VTLIENTSASPSPQVVQADGRLRAGRRLVLTMACVAMAMVGLDTAIVNVALPSMQRDLGVGPATSQWFVVAYSLLLGGLLLLGGRMADRLGRRRIFLTGLMVFTAASLLAGAAPGSGVEIAARGAQGLGAALVVPAALSLLAVTFPEGRERSGALGIFGGVGGAAGSVGVVVSGLLAAGPGWRWAFLINVPVGLALMTAAMLFLGRDHRVDRGSPLDLAGAVTVTGGLLLGVYALHHGAGHGWASPVTLVLLAVAVGLLLAFLRIETRSGAPLVPGSVVRNRSLVAANVTAFFAQAALLSFIFIASLLMQQVVGYSPAITGAAWLSTTVTVLPAAMVGGRLAARIGVRWLLVTGLSAVTLGTLWLTRTPLHANYVTDLLPAFLLVGVGFGLCGPALQIGALSGVTRSAAGLASGLVETMREIGGAAGVAAVATVLVGGSGLTGFHTAFAVIGVIGVLGLVAAVVGFARRVPVNTSQ
jgi:EmrB/QacA subfamily drug resistance transporter